MSSLPERLNSALGGASSTSVWVRRFLIVLTVLGCMVIVGIVFWFLGIIAHPIILLFIGVVIAYLLYPLSKRLGRHMPRALAIFLTYGIVAAVLFIVSYFMLLAALSQLNALVHEIQVFYQNYQAG
jgi:predicted PurR-regulated permease PerM